MRRALYAERVRQMERRARKTKERECGRQIHADEMIRRYLDAVREDLGDVADKLKVTYDAHTGYYYVEKRALREKGLTASTQYHYAKAHEREMLEGVEEA